MTLDEMILIKHFFMQLSYSLNARILHEYAFSPNPFHGALSIFRINDYGKTVMTESTFNEFYHPLLKQP